MKIALLGAGKTGSKVHDVVSKDDMVTDFNHDNPPTKESLQEHDVIICFLPGEALLEHFQLLIDSGVPVVNGATGFEWPQNADDKIKKANVAWITANNFSLGMQLVHDAIVKLGNAPKLLDDISVKVHEIHHTQKKDAPSGTALKWQEWFGQEVEITSERTGDIVGDHTLTFETPSEVITLRHQAKDRALFAAGAVWAARQINELEPGLHKFEDVVDLMKGVE